jgi:large subunit ribosomal protein L24
MNKIRKGDQVVVLSGKDKGRQGTVLLVDGEKVTVENINKAKKHQKPRQGKQAPVPGGIVDKTMPLHISKIAIWNGGAKKADRVGIKVLNDGKRVRFFKSNGEVIDA